MKPSDSRCIPQCHECHMQSHTGEKRYWKDMNLPLELCNALFMLTGDYDAAVERIVRFNRAFRNR